MKSLSYFDALATQVAKHPVSVRKLEWKGATGLAAARFLQVHDAYTTPAEASVPLKSWPIYTDAPGFKLFDVGELVLADGLYICVSTTEATKTLAAGADKYSALAVELQEAETPSGTTFAGDLSTGDEVLQVWSEATGPKRLLEIITRNTSGSARYLQIHADDTPATAVLVESFLIPAGTTKRLTFGKDGREVSKQVAQSIKNGCTLAYSTTAGTYTAVGSNVGWIQAEYK